MLLKGLTRENKVKNGKSKGFEGGEDCRWERRKRRISRAAGRRHHAREKSSLNAQKKSDLHAPGKKFSACSNRARGDGSRERVKGKNQPPDPAKEGKKGRL